MGWIISFLASLLSFAAAAAAAAYERQAFSTLNTLETVAACCSNRIRKAPDTYLHIIRLIESILSHANLDVTDERLADRFCAFSLEGATNESGRCSADRIGSGQLGQVACLLMRDLARFEEMGHT